MKPNRILSILLTLALSLGLLALAPVTASAYSPGDIPGTTGSGADQSDPVCVDTYAEFKAALQHTGVSYVRVTGNITYLSDDTDHAHLDCAINIAGNKALQLDANVTYVKNTLDSPNKLYSFIGVAPGRVLDITGSGTIKSGFNANGCPNAIIFNRGTLGVSGVTLEVSLSLGNTFGRAIYCCDGSTTVIHSGTFKGVTAMVSGAPTTVEAEGDNVNLTIEGGSFSNLNSSGTEKKMFGLSVKHNSSTQTISLSGGTFGGIRIQNSISPAINISNLLAPGYGLRDASNALVSAATTEITQQVTVKDVTPPILPGGGGTITTASVTNNSLTLNWTKATDIVTAQSALRYYVYQKSGSTFTISGGLPTGGTLLNAGGTLDIATYAVTGLSASTTYYFVVLVEDGAGNKAAYAVKTQATTAAPTLTYTATISPTSKTFAGAIVGYVAQAAQAFTITNTGTGTITGLSAALSSTANFEISAALSPASIAPGGTATVSVRPKTGLAANTYTATLTVTGSNGVSLPASLSFTVSATATYTATISPTSKTFTGATVGYGTQAAQEFTITNTGSGTITGLSAALSSTANFEISAALSTTSIAPGGTATVSVRPKTGLAANTYTATLTITGSNGVSLPATLSFTVNPAGGTTYTLTVANGTGGGNYAVGAVVTITASAAPARKAFDKWTVSGGGTIGDAKSATTTFTMPASNVTVTASYRSGIFGTNAKWDGQWWHYLLFFICFGFIWMWF